LIGDYLDFLDRLDHWLKAFPRRAIVVIIQTVDGEVI
jgi:hypothetical protein